MLATTQHVREQTSFGRLSTSILYGCLVYLRCSRRLELSFIFSNQLVDVRGLLGFLALLECVVHVARRV